MKRNDLAHSLDELESRVKTNLNELETRVKTATDWRYQVREHTEAALGIAFSAGALAALIL